VYKILAECSLFFKKPDPCPAKICQFWPFFLQKANWILGVDNIVRFFWGFVFVAFSHENAGARVLHSSSARLNMGFERNTLGGQALLGVGS